jgi:hypothetical protein
MEFHRQTGRIHFLHKYESSTNAPKNKIRSKTGKGLITQGNREEGQAGMK